MSDSAFLAIAGVLVVATLASIHLIASSNRSIWFKLLMFVPILVAIPVLYAAYPDWINPSAPWGVYKTWVANWIGVPLSILTVPVCSAIYAFRESTRNQYRRRAWTYIIEIAAAVAWFVLWSYFEITIGWVRIFI
jgi:hypothetical protein